MYTPASQSEICSLPHLKTEGRKFLNGDVRQSARQIEHYALEHRALYLLKQPVS